MRKLQNIRAMPTHHPTAAQLKNNASTAEYRINPRAGNDLRFSKEFFSRRRPALAQEVRGGFGLALPGEDALFVADGAGDALLGREIREIPDVLADHKIQPVKAPVEIFE